MTSHCFVQFCQDILPFASHIVSEEYAQKLLRFAKLFPADFWLSSFIFEFLGNTKELSPDFSIGVYPAIAKTMHKILPTTELLSSDEWKQFFSFLGSLIEQNIFKKNLIPLLWLEFDLGSSPVWPPSPSIHFRTLRAHYAKDLITTLFSSHLYANLSTDPFIQQLYVRYVSLMLPRGSDSWRLYLYGTKLMDQESLAKFLCKKAPSREAIAVLEKIKPYLGSLALQTGLDPSKDKAIGIECFVSQNPIKHRKNWESILNILRKENLVSQEKANATISWIGKTQSRDFLFTRSISHVKLSWHPTQKIQTKIYLTASRQGQKQALLCSPIATSTNNP